MQRQPEGEGRKSFRCRLDPHPGPDEIGTGVRAASEVTVRQLASFPGENHRTLADDPVPWGTLGRMGAQ